MITTRGLYVAHSRRPLLESERRDECYFLGCLRRVLWLHREALAGRYPNCRTTALVFSVSTKTILRDVNLMRRDFGLALRYDRVAYGFFYGKAPGNPFEAIFRKGFVLPPPIENGERRVRGPGSHDGSPRLVAEYDVARSAAEFLERHGV